MSNYTFTELSRIEKILNGSIECLPDDGGLRLHDDHDGTYEGTLWVQVGPDGDAWVNVINRSPFGLRFRNSFGGGRSLRVHNALLILAHAIKMDNLERPDKKHD
jgi:hypothetical protein